METKNLSKYQETLINLGLNDKEAQIYELLLKAGATGIKPLLSDTGLKRGNAYYHLDSLIEKGLVEKIDEPGKTIRFLARHPENLELILAKQKANLSNAQDRLQKTLPELRSLFQLISTKPGVKFYEGKEGIIRIYEYLLSQGENIDSIEDKGEMAIFIPEYVKKFVNNRISKKIFNRVIAPSSNPINTTSPKELRETRALPTNQFPFRMDIKIAGNLVSLISFQKDSPVGILIENKEIADNFKMLFELIWGLLTPKTGLRELKQ